MQTAGTADPFWTSRTLDYVHSLEAARTREAVLDLFCKEIGQVGFHSHVITTLDRRNFVRRIIARQWHPHWAEMYAEKDLNKKDPIRRKLWTRPRSMFLWSEAAEEARQDQSSQLVMNYAKDFRMNEGLCVPIYHEGTPLASISISGEKPDLGPGVRLALHVVSLLSYNRLSAVSQPQISATDPKTQLTDRECEVLQWVLVGKTDRDIGEILNITRRTARAHVFNATVKLKAANRTAAAVQALRAGEISLYR